jgi:thiamine monophosphate kinase
MKVFLNDSKKTPKKQNEAKNYAGAGKQKVKQLIRQGAGVSSIEISDKNIKSFESIARKYGVDFAVKKDKTENPPKYLVFFKGRDSDALTAAFTEFTAKQLRKSTKPSLAESLQKAMEKVINQVIDKTKHKDRGREI